MRKTILKIFFLAATCGIVFFSRTNQSGPGAGYTNAPSESNCATSSCHNSSALVTSSSNAKWGKIQLNNNFTGSGYIPDSSYTLKLKYVEIASGGDKWGYQITCLDEATGSPAGTFSTPDSRSQSYSSTVGGKTRSYLGHTSSGVASTDSTEWSIKWKAPNTNVGNVKFYVTLNVADANSGVSGDVIYAKTFSFGPSSLLPTCKIKIQDTLYCSGVALTFDGTYTNSPNKYEWTFLDIGGTPITNNQATPKITYNTPGNYRAVLRVKNNKGLSNYDTLKFSVIQGATPPTLNVGSSVNICKGDSLLLQVKTPSNGHTYSWSPTGQTTQSIKTADSGIYFVTVKNSNKCVRTSGNVVVKVKPKPGINLLKSFSGDTVCAGNPFTLATFITTTPADSFSFVSKNGPFSKKDTIQRVLQSGSATYSAWAKNTFGCVSPEAKAVVVTKAPSAAPTVTTSNITFTSMRFNWTTLANATGYRISFDTGKTWLTPTNGDTGTYYDVTGLIGNTTLQGQVIALTTGQCSQSLAGIGVGTTQSCSPLNYTVQGPSSAVCRNGQATIVIKGLAGKKVGIRIDGNFRGTDTVQTVTVVGSKDYQIGVIDSTAVVCGYTNKIVNIQEDSVRTPVSNLGKTANFCSNSNTVSLPMNATKHATADSVLFYANNAIAATKNNGNFTYTVKNNDSVWVVGKNSRGCVSEPGAKTMVVINPIPNAAFTSSNVHFQYKYKASQSGGTHTWKLDTMTRSGDSSLFNLTPYVNKTVKIKHTITVNGCSSSDSSSFTVPDFNSTKTLTAIAVKVYPNPANDVLNIVVKDLKGSATIQFYNSTGQLVQTNVVKPGINTIKILALPAGVLHYTLTTSSSQTTGSIVIER